MKDRGIANRATFVVDIDGKISHIEEGSAAIDISGALNACSRTKGKH
jgi:peroxiredoxin